MNRKLVGSIYGRSSIKSLSPAHGKLIVLDTTLCDKFVSELWQVDDFLWVLRFPPPTKLTATHTATQFRCTKIRGVLELHVDSDVPRLGVYLNCLLIQMYHV